MSSSLPSFPPPASSAGVSSPAELTAPAGAVTPPQDLEIKDARLIFDAVWRDTFEVNALAHEVCPCARRNFDFESFFLLAPFRDQRVERLVSGLG